MAYPQAVPILDRTFDQTTPVLPTVPHIGPPPPIQGKYSYRVSEHETQVYRVSEHRTTCRSRGSLIDRGANGGILGNDARVFRKSVPPREVDVTGIDNHEINSLRIVDASARVLTQHGPAILILQQYAYHGLGTTIHSAGQIEHYKNRVNDRSVIVGGTQCIRTNNGFVIPIDIIQGLPYMKMAAHTDTEWTELPHIVLTGSAE